MKTAFFASSVLALAIAMPAYAKAPPKNPVPTEDVVPADATLASGTAAASSSQTADRSVLSVSGRIGSRGKESSRMHQVSLQRGMRYGISLESADFDPELTLSINGSEIESDDDGGDGTDSYIEYSPNETGTYNLRVSRAAGDSSGEYQLTVRALPPLPAPERPTMQVAGTLQMQRLTDALRPESPRAKGRPIKDYLFSFEAGKRVILMVDKMAGSLDPVVEIYAAGDQNGEPIDRNDDGGDGTNSLLIFTPDESGNYIIRVTSADSDFGRFRLQVGTER